MLRPWPRNTHRGISVGSGDTFSSTRRTPHGNRDLTAADVAATLSDNDVVLVDWWASWCGPCRMFAPVYEAASRTHEDVVLAKVDTDAQQEMSAAAQITSIPPLMAFRDGILVLEQAGALPARALEQVLQAVRDLDMDEIRASLAEQQTAAAQS